jgi:hypothetical protein
VDKRAGDVYSSALAARKLAERALYKIAEIEHFGKLRYARLRRRTRDAVERGAAEKVIVDTQRAVKRGALENHAERALYFIPAASERAAVYGDAAAIAREHTAENVYRGGFSRAVNTEKSEKLAFAHAKADAVYRLYLAEAFGKILYFYYIFHLVPPDFVGCNRSFIL